MKTRITGAILFLLVTFSFQALLGLATRADAQEKANTEITVRVPERGHDETEVKVNGKKYAGEGEIRKLKFSLEKGKEVTFTVEAMIQPNNYTKITRTKKITFKGGDNAEVDLTKKDSKNDKIVVRFVPTPDDIVDKMSEMAKVGKDDVVYDLGCGDAVMLIRPIQKFGAKKGVGVEIDPKILKKAQENVKNANLEERIELRKGDMLKLKSEDLADATVVLLYIGDDLGERVAPVLQKALKPGARIVSHRFTLGDWKPTRTETVTGADGGAYDLLLWIVGDKKK
jgi:uncharacterized protein (TIGR03000 family)